MSVSDSSNRRRPVVCVAIVCLILAAHTRADVRVWASDLSLWSRAVQEAPTKPRVWVNVGVAFAMNGQFADADAAFQHADVLASQAYVPIWDQREAHRLAGLNHATMAQLVSP